METFPKYNSGYLASNSSEYKIIESRGLAALRRNLVLYLPDQFSQAEAEARQSRVLSQSASAVVLSLIFSEPRSAETEGANQGKIVLPASALGGVTVAKKIEYDVLGRPNQGMFLQRKLWIR